MEKIQLLERWFRAFIDLDTPREFFQGMADYLEFADSIPEFDKITAEIVAQRKPFEIKAAELERLALSRIKLVLTEIKKYVEDNRIENQVIQGALNDCDGWLNGRIAGDNSLPIALHIELEDAVKALYEIPEHKDFATKYIEFTRSKAVSRYVFVKELIEFNEFEQEIERKTKSEMWGQLLQIARLYDAVKKGRERHKDLVKEYEKTKSSRASFDILNYSVFVGEWALIEEERSTSRISREPTFFNVKKVRPWLIRLHNFIVTKATLLNKKDIQKPTPEMPSDMVWENIEIRFLNSQEVIVKIQTRTGEKVHQTNYEGMFFKNRKTGLPNEQWKTLKNLSENGGELDWKSSKATPFLKKRKQLLANGLKKYFHLQDDPFFPYRRKNEKSYKLKINLIPEAKVEEDLNKKIIEDYRQKHSPEVYENDSGDFTQE